MSDVQHRESKAGRGWAIFTVEDYDDSYEFKIFGEDYLKLRHFLVPNSFIHARVFIKEGWTNRDTGKKSEPRIQYSSMLQLHDVMEKHSKKLTIQMPLEDLENDRIDRLKDLFTIHKGEKQLHFLVYEMADKVKLNMPSRTQKIEINKELLDELRQEQVNFRLN